MCCGGSPQETSVGPRRAYLSLGSNRGNREAALRRGVEALERVGIRVLERSSVYETEPTDFTEQPWFLNCVVRVETALAPEDLLEACKGIEEQVGRRPGKRFGPRVLDIDILLYEDEVVDTEDLKIPHPRMEERRFVLIPLLEIAPRVVEPRGGRPVAEMLERLDEGKQVTRSASIAF